MSLSTVDPGSSPLSKLIRQCAEQTERFRQRLQHDPGFCYELFRRALCERCEPAWDALFRQYESQVRRWVGTGFRLRGAMLEAEDVVNESFTRFWRAITAENFERFGTLKALLGYLQRCTITALIDMTRGHEFEQTEFDPGTESATHGAPTVNPIDPLDRDQFWNDIIARLNGRAEVQLVIATFVYGYQPAQLADHWPDLFPDAATVYRIKERVLKRLGRDERLGSYFGSDDLAAMDLSGGRSATEPRTKVADATDHDRDNKHADGTVEPRGS